MDLKNPFVLIFILFFAASTVTRLYLSLANYFYRRKHLGMVSPELEGRIDLEKMKKIDQYSNVKLVYSLCSLVINQTLALLLLCFKFYPWLVGIFECWTLNPYFLAYLFFGVEEILETILSIPGSLYFHFGIEKKFGFNKMTIRLWLTDLLKNLLLSLIIEVLLLSALVLVIRVFDGWWWLPTWAVLVLFSLAMQVIYPQIIAPLFNKFSPLPDGELRDKLTNLLIKAGFRPDGVFVVDSSKRSTHSNAYFTGIGKAKRIVLYDTLIAQMTPDELTAVMGHEIGHRKKGHILKGMIISFAESLIAAFVASRLLLLPSLYEGFGFIVSPDQMDVVYYIGLFLLSIISSPVLYFFHPLSSWRSRRNEYEADRYSAQLTGLPEALIEGLIKLNLENLSNLYPAPCYVRFYASHPPLLQRISALRQLEKPENSATKG